MASIRERNGKFNVIYSYTNEKGERKQKWETYETKAEAKRRKKEIEYKKEMGSFVVRKCKTLDELITEYVALYGKENWALSTYEGNVSLINNYILPIIGDTKLSEINTRFIERYYQSLLKRRAVINPLNKTSRNEFVSSSTVRDINKLLRNCFEQAVKWELMEKNPCTHGLPLGDGAIRGPLKKLIEDYNLPPVVFHSFRHSSVTYKLKLNGGDIKAVQGDSGHAQVNMVTDVYSHILDDDRRKNAELFEEAFYEKKNLDPQMHVQQENNNTTVADEVDPELLAKVLANPEMRALLNSLAKTMK